MLSFIHRTPFFRLLAPLIAGILAFMLMPNVPQAVLLTLLLFALSFIFISFLPANAKNQFAFRWVFGVGISFLLLVTGYYLSLRANSASEFHFTEEKNLYLVELTGAPLAKRNSYKIQAKVLGYQQDTSEFKADNSKVILYLQKNDSAAALLYGDRILVQAQMQPPQAPLNPDAFDFGAYLRRQGVAATAYVQAERWQRAGQNNNFSLMRLADRCQKYLLNIYRSLGITGDEFAIVAALTLGYTDDIAPELTDAYSASGAIHILSVSGLHVAIVYGFLLFVMNIFLKNKPWARFIKSLIIIVALWFYAFITGLSPSVMRAAFMCSIVALSMSLGRKAEIYNSIFLSAFVLLLINPNNLFNIGFQLSYAAVLSIVIFAVPSYKLLNTANKLIVFAADIVIVSFAAQLGTAPFTIYYFHTFPAWFLLTNIVAIPLSTIIIYVSISALALSSVTVLSGILAGALKLLLVALNNFIHFVFMLPMSVLNVSLNFEQMWLIVFALVLCCVFYYSKKYLPLILALCCILFALLLNLGIKYQTLISQKFVVYSAQRNTHVSFIEGNKNTVFTTDSTDIERIASNYWDNNKLAMPDFIGENGFFSDGFVEFYGKKFYILTNDFFRRRTSNAVPFAVDYLVIGALQKPQVEQLLTCLLPKKVIICDGVSAYYSAQTEKVCADRNIPVHNIGTEGALTVDL
ncbi:MAG: ComEC family competence protein [Prevotellaceae bacterium]|jgi:competence protein ComEC|nr:ComEC family competence protein [Prevotellaceae bacterium]